MKTQDQVLKIEAREVFAWLVLTFAVLLFGITVTFAQGTPAMEDGKIRIRIDKEVNGERTKFDTTFDAKDKDQLRDFMSSLNEDFDLPPWPPAVPKGMVAERSFNSARMSHFDEKDLEKLKSDLKEMRLEMFADSMFPDFPPFNMDGEEFLSLDPDHGAVAWMRHGGCIHVNMDSLGSDDRVIVLNDEDSEVEHFERIESGEGDDNSVQVIIRKSRKKVPGDEPGGGTTERLGISEKKPASINLESFTNPGDGRFTLKFSLDKKGDALIRITDTSGKEVYSETKKNFSGEYSKQFDISKHGKGAYLLTITQGEQTVTKKIIVE